MSICGIQLTSVVSWINRSGAIIVGDVKSSDEIVNRDQPRSRRSVCRLLIALFGLVLLIVVIVWLSAVKAPTRQERHWLQHFTGSADDFFMAEDRAAKLFDGRLECPCLMINTSFTPPELSRGYPLEIFAITSRDKENRTFRRGAFPQEVAGILFSDPFYPQLCCDWLLRIPCTPALNLTNHFCNSLIKKFTHYLQFIAAPTLLNPRQYMYRTCRDLTRIIGDVMLETDDMQQQMNTDRRAWTYVLYLWLNTFGLCQNLAIANYYAVDIHDWPPLNDIYFWQMSNDIKYRFMVYKEQFLSDLGVGNLSVALSLEFNWELYYQLCGPAYCDEFINNSRLWNLFEALAQVGGFLSLALLILRIVIWPAVRVTFGWPGPDELHASPPITAESELASLAISTN